MARDPIRLNWPKEDEETKEGLLYRREYAPTGWSARHGGGLWPWNYKGLGYVATSTTSTSDDGETCSDSLPVPTRPRRSRQYCRTVVAVVSILCLAAYVFVTAPMAISAMLARRRFTCGSTIEEARARGCTFDPLTVQWLPAQCSRAGLDEFLTAHGTHSVYRRSEPESEHPYPDQNATERTWRYYTDKTQTEEYVHGLETAPLGHYVYHTTRGEHLAHCAYILVRGAEARAAGERVDLLSNDAEHTRHCALFLFEYARNAPHFDTVNTPGDVMLGSC